MTRADFYPNDWRCSALDGRTHRRCVRGVDHTGACVFHNPQIVVGRWLYRLRIDRLLRRLADCVEVYRLTHDDGSGTAVFDHATDFDGPTHPDVRAWLDAQNEQLNTRSEP